MFFPVWILWWYMFLWKRQLCKHLLRKTSKQCLCWSHRNLDSIHVISVQHDIEWWNYSWTCTFLTLGNVTNNMKLNFVYVFSLFLIALDENTLGCNFFSSCLSFSRRYSPVHQRLVLQAFSRTRVPCSHSYGVHLNCQGIPPCVAIVFYRERERERDMYTFICINDKYNYRIKLDLSGRWSLFWIIPRIMIGRGNYMRCDARAFRSVFSYIMFPRIQDHTGRESNLDNFEK